MSTLLKLIQSSFDSIYQARISMYGSMTNSQILASVETAGVDIDFAEQKWNAALTIKNNTNSKIEAIKYLNDEISDLLDTQQSEVRDNKIVFLTVLKHST